MFQNDLKSPEMKYNKNKAIFACCYVKAVASGVGVQGPTEVKVSDEVDQFMGCEFCLFLSFSLLW